MSNQGQVGLYRLYDDADRLLYIGITSDHKERWRQHQGDKIWWPQVSRKAIEWFDDRSVALQMEALAIKNECPLHNGTHQGAARHTADELLQGMPAFIADHLRSHLGGKPPSEADFQAMISTISNVTTLLDALAKWREVLIAAADDTGPYADRQILAKAAGMPRSRLYRILDKYGRPRDRRAAE